MFLDKFSSLSDPGGPRLWSMPKGWWRW